VIWSVPFIPGSSAQHMEKGTFDIKLLELYDIGRRNQWKIVST
jgi:hypothetical protein